MRIETCSRTFGIDLMIHGRRNKLIGLHGSHEDDRFFEQLVQVAEWDRCRNRQNGLVIAGDWNADRKKPDCAPTGAVNALATSLNANIVEPKSMIGSHASTVRTHREVYTRSETNRAPSLLDFSLLAVVAATERVSLPGSTIVVITVFAACF